jgi:uncharacterized protein YbcC (UPF0753/DUF2309 family)
MTIDHLSDHLRRASQLLPPQAPLGDFNHLNILQELQHLHFHDAIADAHARMGCRGYHDAASMRDALRIGRIRPHDLDVAISRALDADLDLDPAALAPWSLDPAQLTRLAMLHDLDAPPPLERDWIIERGDLDLPMLAACKTPQRPLPRPASAAERLGVTSRCERSEHPGGHMHSRDLQLGEQTWRGLLHELTGEDAAARVNPVLLRYAAAYLDGGMARWAIPGRDAGLWSCWRHAMRHDVALLPSWLKGLRTELSNEWANSAETALAHYLDAAGVPDEARAAYIERATLETRGWSGIFHRLEHHPEDRTPGAPPATLTDYLATKLALDHHAALAIAQHHLGYDGPLRDLAGWLRAQPHLIAPRSVDNEQDTWRLLKIAGAAGWSTDLVAARSDDERHALLRQLDRLTPLICERLWLEAYERGYIMPVLRALHDRRERGHVQPSAPRFQLIACMDDREEGLRRHFESLAPDHETLGGPGFFGVPIHYVGLGAPGGDNLCPIVVKPKHEIHELIDPRDAHKLTAWQRRHDLLRSVDHGSHVSSRDMLWGSVLTPIFGALSLIPLLSRAFAPNLHARINTASRRALEDKPRTVITTSRADLPARADARVVGFTIAEQADMLTRTFMNIGLTSRFGRIFVILAHGASSINNPHSASYDCGACGGRHGGPNARTFAQMANNNEVRAILVTRGIHIPDTTWFIGADHDTTTEQIEYFDLDLVPPAWSAELAALTDALDRARALHAQERCRKFYSAPADASPAAALRHVEGRAEDLSQARPELGHMTNACCIIGRRALSRGLFLDRRSFLISYDPTIDPDATILERQLAAAGPVGAGINLDYYFCTVDNERFGAGTKLPHNMTSMIGVMDGASSDLKTGLPRQAVEQHEAMRLTMLIETTPEAMLGIFDRQPGVAQLFQNQWLLCITIDPSTGALHEYVRGHGFQPLHALDEPSTPTTPSSRPWYAGRREPLLPALLLNEPPTPT